MSEISEYNYSKNEETSEDPADESVCSDEKDSWIELKVGSDYEIYLFDTEFYVSFRNGLKFRKIKAYLKKGIDPHDSAITIEGKQFQIFISK